MLNALRVLNQELPFTISVVDVDSDEALIAQYDELVPVLVGITAGDTERAVNICHYFFDAEKVRAFVLEK
jgi:hypothetical protein